MKKNVLNEEISRIKNMMGKINESEFNMVPQEEEVSMEEARYDDDDDEEEDEDTGPIRITGYGVHPKDWVIDVYIPELQEEVKVYISSDGYDVESIIVDDETTELSPINEEMKSHILELVKEAISSGMIKITPYLIYDLRRKEWGDYL
jgi:hypothetical protein